MLHDLKSKVEADIGTN